MTAARPGLLVAAGKADAPETWRGTFDGTTLLFTSASSPDVLDCEGFLDHLFSAAFARHRPHVLLVALLDAGDRAHVAMAAARDTGAWSCLRQHSRLDENDVRARFLATVTTAMAMQGTTGDEVNAA